MFNGLPATTTPAYQFWDFSRIQANTQSFNRISLTDDCAPFQFIFGGASNSFVYITLPSNPPPGKSITFKASNYTSSTGSGDTVFYFYDSSNTNLAGLLYQCQNQVAVTFTYIPELTKLSTIYSPAPASCWVMTNTAFLGDFCSTNPYAVSQGYNNKADVSYATIGGGSFNVTTGSYATVGGGSSNSNSGSYATVGGGSSNNATGSYATVGGGNTNNASGQYSAIPGGNQATTRSVYGAFNYASGRFATQGDAQIGDYVYRLSNATGTIVYLTTDGTARSGTNQAVISTNNYAYAFDITVVARDTTNNTDQAAWKILGLISNNAGTVSITGTPVVTLVSATSGATTNGWGVIGAVTISADATNKALSIGVTQVTTNTLHWVARVETTEVG